MGGHGGLNILPQKKWNVYNYDNRAIVDKDKKQAAAKKKAKLERQRQDRLQSKIDVLRNEGRHSESQSEEIKQRPQHSLISEQLKKLNEQQKHINLFENEQQIIENREIVEIKRLQQAQFLKDKNMDYSSKFLGTYASNDKMTPWYAKDKGYDLDYKKKIKHQKRQENRQRSRSRDKKQKKQKEQKKSQIDLLREKRLKRQKKQRQKAMKLLGK